MLQWSGVEFTLLVAEHSDLELVIYYALNSAGELARKLGREQCP
jgi:hypothetical protein